MSARGDGFRVKFSRIPGSTANGVLSSAVILPCILGEFSVTEDFDWRDYTTIGSGQFSAPAAGGPTDRLLRKTDLDTMTIDWHAYATFLTNPDLTPAEAKRMVYEIGRSHSPFTLLVDEQLGVGEEELRMNATIRSITRTTRPGEADTRYYTLTISEWRNNEISRRGEGGGARKLPTTATLNADTTLAGLANFYYAGVPVSIGWRAIARANNITNWGANTPLVRSKRFKAGQKVKIPATPSFATKGQHGFTQVGIGGSGIGSGLL